MRHSLQLCILALLLVAAHADPHLPASSFNAFRSTNLSHWLQMRQIDADASPFQYLGPSIRRVLMINGTADDTFSLTFFPQIGNSSVDYQFVFRSSQPRVLDPSVDVAIAETASDTYANLTVALDFARFPGKTSFTIEARRKLDASLYASFSIDYIAAGLVIYLPASDTIVSGAGRSFQIQSFEDVYRTRHWDFSVFVQYLNGTNSDEILQTTDVDPSAVFQLSDINSSFISYSAQILWDSATCQIADAVWDGEHLALKPGCGMGFAIGYVNASFYDGFHFAYDFEENRAGALNTFFQWDTFTFGTDFEDELYTTYFLTEIAGQPPTVVRRVDPANPYDMNGGQDISVEMINSVHINITSFNVNGVKFPFKPGTHIIFAGPDDFYETATFVTEPGTGKRLPWTISATRLITQANESVTQVVSFIDQSGFLFSYDDEDIVITSISPAIISEVGGEFITITGIFPSFNTSLTNHNVIIGNIFVPRQAFEETSSSQITFIAPPRSDIGINFEYDVVVQIGNSYSAPVRLTYLPSSLRSIGQAFGASKNLTTGEYYINFCGVTTFSIVAETANVDARYQWMLLNDSNDDLLALDNASSIATDKSVLELPNEYVTSFDTEFKVVGTVHIGNLSSTELFTIKKVEDFVIGVAILRPEDRTISVPEVNMRIVAKVELPECYTNQTELIYEWQYEDKMETLLTSERLGLNNTGIFDRSTSPQFQTFTFSFQNRSAQLDGAITPTRLGRELVIPREQLAHGHHQIRLEVYSTDLKLTGTAESEVNIREALLQAVIGTGQVSRKISDSEDLQMHGNFSFDPDILSTRRASNGLTFEWSCQFSLFFNFTDAETCEPNLLPADRSVAMFNVSSDVLKEKTQLASGDIGAEVFLRYTLQVQKGDRTGVSSQLITVVASEGSELTDFARIEIVNPRGGYIDPTAVKFWEDIIIRPLAQEQTQWKFRLDAPLSEASRFLSSAENIISNPGYYTPSANGDPEFQSLPLGIRADRLKPHETYRFSVSFQEVGKLPNEATVILRTVEVPNLILQTPSNPNGTTETTFRASASTSFPASSRFSYQFYVMEQQQSAREYCIDGCTGANYVRFQIGKPGIFFLQCRLIAADGRTLLAVRNSTELLTISSSPSLREVDVFDNSIDRDYKFGDDGAVNQKGFFFTESLNVQEKVFAMSDSSADEICARYTKKWAGLSRAIIENEVPNTANARNYVSIASNYARLTCVEDSQTLYELLAMVHQSITRLPPEEKPSTASYTASEEDIPNVELERELLRFYNFSMVRAISTISAGSSRARLSPVSGAVNNLILDLSELWVRHISETAATDRVCGWDATYSLETTDGMSIDLEPTEAVRFSANTIHVAVRCNPEQGSSLSTPYSSFEWCDNVYEIYGGRRALFTVAEQFDYPYLSGIQGTNRSDTQRIVMVDIRSLDDSNGSLSLQTDIETETATPEAEFGDQYCYRVSLTMGDDVNTRSVSCSRNVPYLMSPRKQYDVEFERPFDYDAYLKRTEGIIVTNETRNASNVVIAQSNRLGLYGANREGCQGGSLSGLYGKGGVLVGLMLSIFLLIILVTALTYFLVTVFVAGAAIAFDDGFITENWVNRDEYGRGDMRYTGSQFTPSETQSSQRGSTVASGEGAADGPARTLDMSDPQLPDHDTLVEETRKNLPSASGPS